MATLRDIAAEVGVSIRTVSRALTGSGYVSKGVREVAGRLGYRPDPVAQSLRRGRSHEVVVVSHSVDELHMAKIAALERSVRPNGHIVSVMIVRTQDLLNARLVPELRLRKPAGVVVIGALEIPVDALVMPLVAASIPCVPVDATGSVGATASPRTTGSARATAPTTRSIPTRLVVRETA